MTRKSAFTPRDHIRRKGVTKRVTVTKSKQRHHHTRNISKSRSLDSILSSSDNCSSNCGNSRKSPYTLRLKLSLNSLLCHHVVITWSSRGHHCKYCPNTLPTKLNYTQMSDNRLQYRPHITVLP